MRLRNLFETIARTGKGNTAVIGWGRGMGHKGHMMLASSVITKAKELSGDPYFVVSRTVGKDDPITPEEKLAIYKKVFPQQGHIFQAASDEIPDLTRVLSNLNQQGYKNAVVVVGEDQVKAFQYLKNYNSKPDKTGNVAFNFDSLDVISRQETGDPSAGEEGPRATPMRQVLMDPSKSEQEQFAVWRNAMNPELSDEEVMDLMNKAKQRMAQYAAPKKKAVAPKESKEADYGADYQDKVKRLGQMARQGERKTVWDPVKRVYKTVPVNPPKQQGVAESRVDEFLPALAAGAGALARGAAVGAKAISGAALKGAQSVTPGVVKTGQAIRKVPGQVEKGLIKGFEVLNALVPGGIFNPDGSMKGSQYLTKYLTPQQIQQVTQQQGVAEQGYGNHPSQRVDPRTGKKYVPPKSPLGQGVAEKMMPKSTFAGSDKHKLGPAAHAKGKQKGPVKRGQLVGDAEESIQKGIPISEDVLHIMTPLVDNILAKYIK